VFTTRPDTIFGATYLVLSPEHELVAQVTTADQRDAVAAYQKAAALKSDLERTELAKEKSGVFTGAYATNPASNERIPVWIADYVLAHYGTGAIMAVPGHDQRDFAFAQLFGLSITRVVAPDAHPHGGEPLTQAFDDDGVSCNSTNSEVSLDGLPTTDAKRAIVAWMEGRGLGHGTVQYKLRDWLFSRQRYWGEPMPIVFFEDGTRRVLDEDELPLLLPEIDNFQPAGTGESALATVPQWVDFVDAKTGKRARYETNTMPQWAGSCWYYLRYCDPHNNAAFCSPEAERYWMGNHGIDLYIGGAEHAVLHLLYARFWHKVLFDHGLVSNDEPVHRLFHQGLILGEDGRKMSKSLGNTINPDDMVAKYSADAVRLYEMFLGPLEASKPWSSTGIEGVSRFLDRVWRLVVKEQESESRDQQAVQEWTEPGTMNPELDRVLHATIKKTREDVEGLSFNTAVAQFMIFVNAYTPLEQKPKEHIEQFLQCLAPFAPHITEELWRRLGHTESIHLSSFPEYDSEKLVETEVEIVLQVNSKIRGKLVVPADATKEQLEQLATADEGVLRHLEGKQIKKLIVVPGKLVNVIAG
jgi:leucyl-tRNA synthetase